MKRDKIFTQRLDGQMLEIGNWEARTSDGDAFVGLPLTDSRVKMLREGRSGGKSDREIYREMHPPVRDRHSLALEDLTTQKILIIAREMLGEELASLTRLTRPDLIRLVRKIASIKKVKIEINVRLE